jgi:hypothetical protein
MRAFVVPSTPSTLDEDTERLLEAALICPSKPSTLDDEFER